MPQNYTEQVGTHTHTHTLLTFPALSLLTQALPLSLLTQALPLSLLTQALPLSLLTQTLPLSLLTQHHTGPASPHVLQPSSHSIQYPEYSY